VLTFGMLLAVRVYVWHWCLWWCLWCLVWFWNWYLAFMFGVGVLALAFGVGVVNWRQFCCLGFVHGIDV